MSSEVSGSGAADREPDTLIAIHRVTDKPDGREKRMG